MEGYKMQCLYVAGSLTECLLRRGVHLRKVKKAVLNVAGTSTECPHERDFLLT